MDLLNTQTPSLAESILMTSKQSLLFYKKIGLKSELRL